MRTKFSYSQLDNLHILIWLIKDVMWLTENKFFGVLMIIPAFGLSLLLTIRTFKYRFRFLVNLSVTFWIAANSTWMLDEFYSLNIKWMALALFIAGILSMICYYVVPKQKFGLK